MPSQKSSLAADLRLALRLADTADKVTSKRFGATDLRVETKPDLTPVSEADRKAERRLRKLLTLERPGDRIVGEEYGGADLDWRHGRVWVIDPIDGTKNYVRRVPVWATLIGLLVDAVPVAGVVSAPALGRRWWAAAGTGAWASGFGAEPRRLQTSSVNDLADASFSYSDEVGWDQIGAEAGLRQLIGTCWRTRAYGDFYSHMLVAEGAVDIAAEPSLNIWDLAALVPVITEAGGVITSYDGGDPLTGGCALTTNGPMHPQVLELFKTPPEL